MDGKDYLKSENKYNQSNTYIDIHTYTYIFKMVILSDFEIKCVENNYLNLFQNVNNVHNSFIYIYIKLSMPIMRKRKKKIRERKEEICKVFF